MTLSSCKVNSAWNSDTLKTSCSTSSTHPKETFSRTISWSKPWKLCKRKPEKLPRKSLKPMTRWKKLRLWRKTTFQLRTWLRGSSSPLIVYLRFISCTNSLWHSSCMSCSAWSRARNWTVFQNRIMTRGESAWLTNCSMKSMTQAPGDCSLFISRCLLWDWFRSGKQKMRDSIDFSFFWCDRRVLWSQRCMIRCLKEGWPRINALQ